MWRFIGATLRFSVVEAWRNGSFARSRPALLGERGKPRTRPVQPGRLTISRTIGAMSGVC